MVEKPRPSEIKDSQDNASQTGKKIKCDACGGLCRGRLTHIGEKEERKRHGKKEKEKERKESQRKKERDREKKKERRWVKDLEGLL